MSLLHLDRDLAMGWLIRQDAPEAKEIRDYIHRLRTLVWEHHRVGYAPVWGEQCEVCLDHERSLSGEAHK